jgi:hypothetical protein
VLRNFHPKTKSFTFLSAAQRMQTRINRIYSSQSCLPYANDCRHVPVPHNISDHQAGVEMTLRAINTVRRGPSFWKLNTSLYQKPSFRKLVKETIAEFISSKNRYGCVQSWWDMLKFALQFRAKAYSKQQAFQRKMTIQTLEKDLLNINDLVALQPSDNELHLRRARLDQTLADYYEDIQEAARMKAGMKYKSQGERPTKYFTALV